MTVGDLKMKLGFFHDETKIGVVWGVMEGAGLVRGLMWGNPAEGDEVDILYLCAEKGSLE